MFNSSELPLVPLIALAIGALLGWAFGMMRLKTEQERTLEALRRAGLAEDELQRLRNTLEETAAERARLAERAARIPELEDRLKALEASAHEREEHLARLRELSGGQAAELKGQHEQLEKRDLELREAHRTLDARNGELRNLGSTLATVRQELQGEREQNAEKLNLLEQARQALSDQFKAIAGEILDEKSRKFTELNQTNLDQLLKPFGQQITDFRNKVEEVYVNESKDRSALKEQVTQLQALNNALHEDANNLTLALRGDRKSQGNWGEIILDDVLERAGLREGEHYRRQSALKTDEGTAIVIPDIVINLPGGRHIVVDSKFTLPDYRAFANADNDVDRANAQKRHLIAIRNHIKGLSEKNYQAQYELKTLDFVVMFIPLEPAFMMAVTNDPELFTDAWNRNVLLVSPSTLLFVVRTIAYLWRQDALSANAREISKRGAELYDRLCGFAEELEKVGRALGSAQASYDDARRKLSIGKGNVIRQAEMLRELGVKPAKALKAQWTDGMEDSNEAEELPGLE